MYSETPPISSTAACSRSVTVAMSSRSPLGFRLISMRPAFIVVLVPSTPMKADTLCTAGSFSTTSDTARCFCDIAWNEMLCEASVTPWITPVSCTGKKPFGIARYSTTVSASVPIATSSVARCRPSTQFSARP